MELKTLNQKHRASIVSLLSQYKLPIEDINLEKQRFLGLIENNKLVTIGALELYEPSAILRSLAVSHHKQNSGLGRKMVIELISLARSMNIQSLYLLTETATSYFERLGFGISDRSKVPKPVLQSEEFSHLCPDSAVCMKLKL